MRRLWLILLGIVLVPVAALALLMAGLNSGPGRLLAAREINKLAGPGVQVAGLAGHFPADIKLQNLQLANSGGLWLQAQNLELRWRPLRLLRGEADVQALTAEHIDVLRQPVPGGKNSGRGGSMPALRLDIERLEIGTLTLAPPLAGETVVLHVQGAAHVLGLAQGNAQLDAATPDGTAQYFFSGGIDHETISMRLRAVEPPGGLIGHFAGPQAQAPLTLDASLVGPRGAAAMNFAAALGAARLTGTGTLGLVPAQQFADVTLAVPELAPFGALTGQTIGGSTQLHLRLAQTPQGSAAIALDGAVALRKAPAGWQNFLGARDEITLRAGLQHNVLTIATLHLSGANFALTVSGKLGRDVIALTTGAEIKQLAVLSPTLAGSVTESGSIAGTPSDFAVQAELTGTIGAKGQASGPFHVALSVEHLPKAASGTLTGSGMLENAPLRLDATFARAADGSVQVRIDKAQWHSATMMAALKLAPGATLPTGTAAFAVARLQDFAPFVPMNLHGAVSGDFAFTGHGDIKLDMTAKGLVVKPAFGALSGNMTAAGPVQALAVRAQLSLAGGAEGPAGLSFAGTLDVPARAARLASLSGSWRGLDARLQEPAAIETQPALSVQHLNLALAGGSVALDGVLSPRLNARISLHDLPASIANAFAPQLRATGMINVNAALTGPPASPSGTVTMHVAGLHVGQGPAAALAPADIAGSARLAGLSARLDLALNAGPDIALAVHGQAPLRTGGAMNLQLLGRVDLRLLNLFLTAQGTAVRGEVRSDLQLTGTPQAPDAAGNITLSDGSIENIGSGLNLTQIGAQINAQGRRVALQNLTAMAGHGSITGQGTLGLEGDMPIALTLNATNASPVTSDLLTETLDGKVTVNGALRGAMALAGHIDIAKADINIPHGLPPSVANLPILNAGQAPPPLPAPPPPIALDLDVGARNQIFVRGDGLFAEFGGHVHLGGTMETPDPEGKFNLVRGEFALAGKSLQFTQGSIGFAGGGFVPTLDLVASASSAEVSNASLTLGGTAAKPVITLSSTPPLPSDEILAQLLFGQSAASLTPFQAASLAAALAQISGLGGGFANPLDKIRGTLGLDQLSFGGTGSGPPSLQAGRYVAPGVYVGATQSANGQGTQVNVEVNLYKGLKLQSATGTSSTGSNSNSVGLSYQFNY